MEKIEKKNVLCVSFDLIGSNSQNKEFWNQIKYTELTNHLK